MDYTERIIRERLDGKRTHVPSNFWNLETFAMAIIVIVEEKWGITNPKQIPVENVKCPFTQRLYEEYNYLYCAITRYGYSFRDILLWIYQKDITEDDWFFIDNWREFMKLRSAGYTMPSGFSYNKKAIKSCLKYIIEEEWNIKDPKQLAIGSIKDPFSVRLYNNYQFLHQILYTKYPKYGDYSLVFFNIINGIYDISLDDWFLLNDIDKLLDLLGSGYDLPKGSVKYKDGIIYDKIIEYFIDNNLDKLNRYNIYEECKNYLMKFFDENTVNPIELPWRLMFLCPYSFQPWDFMIPNGFWENECNVKYYLNYEFHVRKRISEDSYNKISANFQKMCKHIGLSKLPNIAPLYSITYLRDMIVWEGPEYEHFINLRGKLESMNLHFGY